MRDVPTLLESGVKVEINGWYSLLGPAKMPAPIVATLNAQVNRMLGQPEFLEKFAALGASAFGGTPQDVVALIRSDMAKYAKAIKESGTKAE